MKKIIVFIFLASILISPSKLLAHCEIPCGIYGDERRIEMIYEDIKTVEKSMIMIEELSKEKAI